MRNHHRSTSVMCRTRPSRDSLEGATARRLSWSAVSPAHLVSNVARWKSSHACSCSRSPATSGGSVRDTSGALHVIPASSIAARSGASTFPHVTPPAWANAPNRSTRLAGWPHRLPGGGDEHVEVAGAVDALHPDEFYVAGGRGAGDQGVRAGRVQPGEGIRQVGGDLG